MDFQDGLLYVWLYRLPREVQYLMGGEKRRSHGDDVENDAYGSQGTLSWVRQVSPLHAVLHNEDRRQLDQHDAPHETLSHSKKITKRTHHAIFGLIGSG